MFSFYPLINVELKKADIFYVSDKLVISRLSRTIWPIFSSFLIFCCYFSNKSVKYEKLGKYWLYWTRNRAITNVYGINNISFKGPQIWKDLPQDTKKSDSLNFFKSKIERYENLNCHCRLCESCVSCVGYIDWSCDN